MANIGRAISATPGLNLHQVAALRDKGTVYLDRYTEQFHVVRPNEKQPEWVQSRGVRVSDTDLAKLLLKTKVSYQRVLPRADAKQAHAACAAAPSIRTRAAQIAPAAGTAQTRQQHIESGLELVKQSVFELADAIGSEPVAKHALAVKETRKALEPHRLAIQRYVSELDGLNLWQQKAADFLDKVASRLVVDGHGPNATLVQVKHAAAQVLEQMQGR